MGLLVHAHGRRGRDLVFSDDFVRFLATELVPWANRANGAAFAPADVVISGASLGGLTAVYAATQQPSVFGNAHSQSGAFWRARADRSPSSEGWLAGHLAEPGVLPVRFYLEVGRFEPPNMVENNRRVRDVLRARGCTVTYSEPHAGHDYLHWRDSLGRGLIALLGSPRHGESAE
jgi:enterochelin esterase family protein